jgi:dynactin complex subunit
MKTDPTYTVGSVNFSVPAELEFYRNEDKRLTAEITALKAENAELIRRNNRLKRVLERCAALSEEVANEKHEILLSVQQPL